MKGRLKMALFFSFSAICINETMASSTVKRHYACTKGKTTLWGQPIAQKNLHFINGDTVHYERLED